MSKKVEVPDAWDDDWEAQADKKAEAKAPSPPPDKLSKAQRRAQHAEQQRMLWDTAENPGRSYFLETQGVVPLKQDFKGPPQLLSRKPQAPVLARKGDVTNGIAGMSFQDDEEDSEEEARRKQAADLEERQRQARIVREEKQRKYAEARERIMGSGSPGTPPTNSRENSQGRSDRRRGGGRATGGQSSQPTSAGQSPSRSANTSSQLFDPNDMGRRMPRPERIASQSQERPVRQPRPPEKTGRGGFGFARRGGLAG